MCFRSDLCFTYTNILRFDVLTAIGLGFVRCVRCINNGEAFWVHKTRRLTRRILFGTNRDKVENSRVPFFNFGPRNPKFLLVFLPFTLIAIELFVSTFGSDGGDFFDIYSLWFWSFPFINSLDILLGLRVEYDGSSSGRDFDSIICLRREGILR